MTDATPNEGEKAPLPPEEPSAPPKDKSDSSSEERLIFLMMENTYKEDREFRRDLGMFAGVSLAFFLLVFIPFIPLNADLFWLEQDRARYGEGTERIETARQGLESIQADVMRLHSTIGGFLAQKDDLIGDREAIDRLVGQLADYRDHIGGTYEALRGSFAPLRRLFESSAEIRLPGSDPPFSATAVRDLLDGLGRLVAFYRSGVEADMQPAETAAFNRRFLTHLQRLEDDLENNLTLRRQIAKLEQYAVALSGILAQLDDRQSLLADEMEELDAVIGSPILQGLLGDDHAKAIVVLPLVFYFVFLHLCVRLEKLTFGYRQLVRMSKSSDRAINEYLTDHLPQSNIFRSGPARYGSLRQKYFPTFAFGLYVIMILIILVGSTFIFMRQNGVWFHNLAISAIGIGLGVFFGYLMWRARKRFSDAITDMADVTAAFGRRMSRAQQAETASPRR